MTPRVSVIVPVRNNRDLLRGTLDALAAQSVTDHEVIVVDDHSTDGSGEEAELDAARGRPVRLIVGPGRGAVAARAAGVMEASAPVLAFTDSDCFPDPRWLEAGLRAIDDGADVVQGRTEPVRPPKPHERTLWSLDDDALYATCNVFYRRAAFDAVGGFDRDAEDRLGFFPGAAMRDLGFGEDTVLGWAVRRRGRSAHAPDAIVRHHVFPVDARESLRRARQIGGFPALFREVPELRETMAASLAEGRRSRLPLYATAAALALGRPRVAAATGLFWVGQRFRRLAPLEPSRRERLAVLPLDLAVEAVMAASLIGGSVRARTIVL